MIIRSLEMHSLKIRFKRRFRHSSAQRVETESVWVQAHGDDFGGTGEGCPRTYVTGENLESVTAFFKRHRHALCNEVCSLEDLNHWGDEHRVDIDRNPAAWCSLELAILELMALDQGIPIDRLLGESAPCGSFHYSAVAGDETGDEFRNLIGQYSQLGFTDFKIKLSGDLSRDREKIQILGEFGIDGSTVRVDANNIFDDAKSAAVHIRGLGCSFRGIEEPVAAGQFETLRHIARETGTPIILDESLLFSDQIAELEPDPQTWIINVRVSKMGGLLRSLNVLKRAERAGIPVIVGAQVGETSILTRAALMVAQAAGSNLCAQEGAFGTLLLETDVSIPSLMFGEAGILDTTQWAFADRPGWGLALQRPAEGLQALA